MEQARESTRVPARRRRKRHVVNKMRLAVSAVVLILVVELTVVALTSPLFAVKKVRVVGNKTVPSAEILRALRLSSDSNIFLVNKQQVAAKLEGNPVINHVRLRRRLPGTLIVAVVERKPRLILETGGVLYEVDSWGVPFRVVKRLNGKLPVISCAVPGRIALGKPIYAAAFDVARECLLLAQEKKIAGLLKITVDQNRDLCLNVRDEFQVKLGRPEQLSEKLDIAVQVREQIPEFRQRGEYIDVATPEAPAFKLRK